MALDIFFHQYGLIREEHLPLLHFTLLELEIVQPGGSYDIGLLGKFNVLTQHLVSRCSLSCLLLLILKIFLILIALANFSKHHY